MTREEAYLKQFYREYKNGAIKRGIDWNLSNEEFNSHILGTCVYCGATRNSKRNYKRIDGHLYMTGIDRIDSNKGYSIDNIVSCCKDCNIAKGNKSVVDFLVHVKRIFKYNMEQMEVLEDAGYEIF